MDQVTKDLPPSTSEPIGHIRGELQKLRFPWKIRETLVRRDNCGTTELSLL
jgi:hypothetical protein